MTDPHSPLSLQLLGGAIIRRGDTPLGGAAAHRHRLALLALLACSPGPVTRDKLIALLWPDRDEEGGRNLLKVAVHELRKLLGDDAIRTTGDQLGFGAHVVDCDVVAFESAMATKDFHKAAGLYAGPFLDGFYMKDAPEFERWADGQRTRIASAYAKSLDQLAVAAEERGDWKAAAQWWRQLAAQDPLRADVALKVMRALAAAGDREGAIKHAEVHATLRRKDFGVDPEPSVAKFAQELMASAFVEPTLRITYPPEAPTHDGIPGVELVRAMAPTVPLRRERKIRWPVVAVAVVAVAVIVTTALAMRLRTSVETPGMDAISRTVLVEPFQVAAADSTLAYLHVGMMEMMAARIGSDGALRATEDRAASPTRPITAAAALSAARRAGTASVILGDVIGGSAGSIEVGATMFGAPRGDVIARATRTVTRGTPISLAADTLAAELMSRAAGESEDRLADLLRHPLPALRTYLAAQQSYRIGRYARAESLFAKTLDIDSSFALAGLGLALANSWNTINEHYGIGRNAALRGRANLSARDRAFVSAFFDPDPALGQPKPAPVYLEAWEQLVHEYPDFAEAWWDLGDRYYHFGGLSGLADPTDQARTAFRRALSLDPQLAAPLHHLIEIYASRGETNDAKTTADRYFTGSPGLSRDATAIGWELATALGDRQWLERLRANFDSMSFADLSRIAWVTQEEGWAPADADRALSALERRAGATYEYANALALRYAFELNAGEPSRAATAARAFEGQLPDQPIAALWGAYASMFGGADTTHEASDVAALRDFGNAALTGNPDHRARQLQARCLAGYSKLERGEAADALRDVKEVESRVAGLPTNDGPAREGRMCSAWLNAAIAVESKSPDAQRLVQRLDTMVLRDRVPPRMALTAAAIMSARLHEKLGQTSLALAASRWREHYTGDPVFLSTQLQMEGDLASRTGDREGARRAYRHYLALRPSPESSVKSETDLVRRKLKQIGGA